MARGVESSQDPGQGLVHIVQASFEAGTEGCAVVAVASILQQDTGSTKRACMDHTGRWFCKFKPTGMWFVTSCWAVNAAIQPHLQGKKNTVGSQEVYSLYKGTTGLAKKDSSQSAQHSKMLRKSSVRCTSNLALSICQNTPHCPAPYKLVT